MLQGKLVLHDLLDTEALAMRIVERSGFVLSYAEREELATYLIEVAWEISTVWRPGAASFSTYATTTLTADGVRSTGNEPGLVEGLGVSRTVSTPGSCRSSYPSTPTVIDWSSLSPRAAATLRQIGTRLADGWTENEIASALGISRSLVRKHLAHARAELAQLRLKRG